MLMDQLNHTSMQQTGEFANKKDVKKLYKCWINLEDNIREFSLLQLSFTH